MHAARSIFLDLADLRAAAGDWRQRANEYTVKTADRPADALLIRPNGRVAWAAAVDEPDSRAVSALREALAMHLVEIW